MHENSITVDVEGRYFNIPTVHPKLKKQMTDQEAIKRFRTGEIRPLGVYSRLEDAVGEAKKRSLRAGLLGSD